jgi:hypothetical protein
MKGAKLGSNNLVVAVADASNFGMKLTTLKFFLALSIQGQRNFFS